MPCYPGASELTRALRRAGAEVWICTTRPYLRLDAIDPDTRHWLRRNKIQFDHVLYGEHKYRDLVKQVDPARVVAVYEDLPDMLMQAIDCGMSGYLRSQPYNGNLWEIGHPLHKNGNWWLRVDGPDEQIYRFLEDLDEWKDENLG